MVPIHRDQDILQENLFHRGLQQVWNLVSGGFVPNPQSVIQDEYLLGLGNEQVTLLDGNGNWQWTNAYAGGKQLATYSDSSTSFAVTGWLGSKRMDLSVTAPSTVSVTCLLKSRTAYRTGLMVIHRHAPFAAKLPRREPAKKRGHKSKNLCTGSVPDWAELSQFRSDALIFYLPWHRRPIRKAIAPGIRLLSQRGGDNEI